VNDEAVETLNLSQSDMHDLILEAEKENARLVAEDLTSKATNPKDAIGSDKMPFHLWPETATIMGVLGLLDGMLKYGRSNWRAVGIRTSVYADALRRHANALFEGEDIDQDSQLHHLCHVLATAAIWADALAKGNVVDDRNYPGGYRALLDKLTPEVARLKAKHAARNPKHYTIQDAKK
jgi:hypothetical protein